MVPHAWTQISGWLCYILTRNTLCLHRYDPVASSAAATPIRRATAEQLPAGAASSGRRRNRSSMTFDRSAKEGDDDARQWDTPVQVHYPAHWPILHRYARVSLYVVDLVYRLSTERQRRSRRHASSASACSWVSARFIRHSNKESRPVDTTAEEAQQVWFSVNDSVSPASQDFSFRVSFPSETWARCQSHCSQILHLQRPRLRWHLQ